MKAQKVIIAVFIVLCLGFQNVAVSSAADAGNNKFSFGLHGATFISYTDIKHSSFFNSASDALTFGGGLNFNYHASPALTLQWRFMYAELEGLHENINLKFESEMFQGSMNARVSLNTLFAPLSPSNQWMNIYGFVGAGMLMHRSNLLNYQTGELIRYAYEGKDGVGENDLHSAFYVPFGLGVNFRLSDRVDIGLESTFNYVASDELDAAPVPGSRKDMYNYTGIGLTFRLGRNTNSMDWAPASRVMYPGDFQRIEEVESNLASVEERQVQLEVDHAADIIELKEDMNAYSLEQSRMGQRISQLGDALEDLSDQFHKHEEVREDKEQQFIEEPRGFFSVQVMAQKQDISIEEATRYLNIDHEINKVYVNGWHKYYSGRFDNKHDAIMHMRSLWDQGIKDAFVVEYKDGRLTPR